MSIEWNGGGLPPIGLEVRVKRPGYNHPRFDRFIGKEVTIVAHDRIDGENVAVFRMKIDDFSDEFDYHALTSGCFEPLNAESDRQNDEAAVALTFVLTSLPRNQHVTEISYAIVQKIANGEIPHITMK